MKIQVDKEKRIKLILDLCYDGEDYYEENNHDVRVCYANTIDDVISICIEKYYENIEKYYSLYSRVCEVDVIFYDDEMYEIEKTSKEIINGEELHKMISRNPLYTKMIFYLKQKRYEAEMARLQKRKEKQEKTERDMLKKLQEKYGKG